MSGEMTGREAGLAGALALAALYFPRKDDEGRILAGFEEATFFAHRKPQAWSGWAGLPATERDAIRQVMVLMSPEWTDPKKLKAAVLALLGTHAPDPVLADKSGGSLRLPEGEPHLADAVIPRVGGAYLAYAQRVTGPFFTFGKRPKAQAFAGPGTYKTRTTYLGKEHGTTSRTIHIPETPGFLEAPGHEALPQVRTRPQGDRVAPSVESLLKVAKTLSEQDKSVAYLHQTLKRFFKGMKTTRGELTELDLTSGDLQVLNAPTGSGKTVLVRVLASWATLNDIRIALAVTDVRATLDMAWDINKDLAYLHRIGKLAGPAHCTPLMSPTSMHRRAMDYAALSPSGRIDQWDLRTRTDLGLLSAGCAQRALMDPPSLYPYGEENCTSLTSAASGSVRHTCSFAPVCGKFQQFYQATDAAVIVTNHANLLEGRTRIGVVLDGQEFHGKARGTNGMSVLELTLRSCDALIIDEIDAFQTQAISRCTSEITLASRKRTTALREIDQDAKNLPLAHEMDLVSPVSHARLMAEMLLLWLCSDSGLKLNPGNETDGPDGASRDNAGWRLARSRDREILELLFPDETSAEEIPPELFSLLDELMPARWYDDSAPGENPGFPSGADWEAIQAALTILTAQRGQDYLTETREEMRKLLADIVPNVHKRSATVNLLVTRSVLRELDTALDNLREQAQALRYLDLGSVRKILEAMRSGTVVTLYPLAMLGRSIHGYQVKGMENKEREAELLTRSFGGDPHTFVSELGGLTSLLTAGVQRPIMGLSATAYLPQAVQEHIHAPVRWWLPDTRPESIVTVPTPVRGHNGDAMRIGGLPPERKPNALRDLGKGLYEQQLAKRLASLERRDEDRARVILAVNSYEQAAYLASGVAQADGLSHRVCLLVKRSEKQSYEEHLPAQVDRMVREELKDFPERGEILIAPLAVIGRGLNIVVGTRSAVSDIYLCVRPVLSIEDTDWLHASVNAVGINSLPPGGSDEPLAALMTASDASWRQLSKILRSPARFSNMDHDLRKELVASMLVMLIQLAGRARRGETDMTLHIVDHSIHDKKFSSDLATIIKQIHADWNPEQRAVMNELYGQALQAFLTYAGLDSAII
ncbi:hypothetical protein ABZT47_28840 [Sphaerisporangium sp. NPDC005289]|uniref:hypothetical protein n=1 Tax=Sphaerisporangium sp. NPDC005289 TaxID=3155247 RepID=UPI0033BA211D